MKVSWSCISGSDIFFYFFSDSGDLPAESQSESTSSLRENLPVEQEVIFFSGEFAVL